MAGKKFLGKVVLITGASSGIGETTAKQFASHGASLVITGRNEENLEKVAGDCKKLGAADVLPIIAEFSKMEEVKKSLDATIDKFSKLDVLVNNAGAALLGNLSGVKMEDFDYLFDVNVKSMVCLTQLAVPHLVETKGNVVNVSSYLSTHQSPAALLYSMTKSAVDQFTKTVALEYASKGVRVNAVNPANVQTSIGRCANLTAEQTNEYYKGLHSKYPMGCIGTTEQVANAIIFLASDDSSWTTGLCFKQDGGRGLTMQD